MYLKPRNEIHVKFINLDNNLNWHGILYNQGIHENYWGKELNKKESWYKLNFIVVRSNFISLYEIRWKKCLVNSNFDSKGRFRKFPQKIAKKGLQNEGKKGKIKSHSRNYIPDPLNRGFRLWKIFAENSFNDLKNI